MRTNYPLKSKLIVLILFLISFFFIPDKGLNQPYPPAPPEQHGQNGPTPLGAPVGGGSGILLALGFIYGAGKLFTIRKEKSE